MTPELCKNSIRTREEEITRDHQRTATADCLLSITRPPVVAPGMYGKTSHVTTGHRSVVPHCLFLIYLILRRLRTYDQIYKPLNRFVKSFGFLNLNHSHGEQEFLRYGPRTDNSNRLV